MLEAYLGAFLILSAEKKIVEQTLVFKIASPKSGRCYFIGT